MACRCCGGIPGPPGPAGDFQSLPGVAALRALVATDDDAVVGINTYDPDNGTFADQGLFQWIPGDGLDDGVTRFNVGGLGTVGPGWQRILAGPITARWAGAVGDGVIDDTVALQRAFDIAATTSHALDLEGFTYATTDTLHLRSNLSIFGHGATIRPNNGTTFNAVIDGAAVSNIVIKDLTLDVNGPNRVDAANTKDGFRIVGLTDALFDNVTVLRTRGTPGSAVAFALTTGLRVRYVNCTGRELGVAGHISDCFYSNGNYIFVENFYCEPTDTGCVFENCSNAGAMNGRIDGGGQGAGIAAGVAGNADVENLFFQGIIINNVIAPVEFGLFGARTNTGKIKNVRFADILVDSAASTFPVIFFYPNPQVNPGNLEYSGRIEDVTIDGVKVIANGGSQGVYATTCDGLSVRGCDMNVDAAAVQVGGAGIANSDACTRVVVEDNVFKLGATATIGIQLQDGDDYLIQDNRVKGGALTAWGVYYFGTCTNCRTPRNIITGSLGDESGIGADNTTQARAAADGAFYGTTTPQPNTGIWPLGTIVINSAIVNTAPYLETTAKPWGWVCTTAGVPGAGAVFTPFFREGRSIGDGGVLNSANALDYVRVPAGSGDYVAYNARGDSSDASKYVGFGFSNASNAAGNLGSYSSDGNGNARIATLATLTIGTQTGANFPAVFTSILDLDAKGWRALANEGGYYLGSTGQFGGLKHATNVLAGVVQLGASIRGELGISAGNAPWSSFLTGLYFRKDSTNAVCAIGFSTDPSDRPAYTKFAAPSVNINQAVLEPGVATTVKTDGALNYVNGVGFTFCYGTVTRYNIALKLVDIAYNFVANTGALAESNTVVAVSGAIVGDKVLIDFGAAGIPAGLLFAGAWVNAANQVTIKMFNYTAAPIAPNLNWNLTVVHT